MSGDYVNDNDNNISNDVPEIDAEVSADDNDSDGIDNDDNENDSSNNYNTNAYNCHHHNNNGNKYL